MFPEADRANNSLPGSCSRCNSQDVLHDVRSEHVCRTCFLAFVRVKAAKRFEIVDRESRSKIGRGTANYILGLSFGSSSSAMVHIFDQLDERSSTRGRPVSSSFRVVHVDTGIVDPSSTRYLPASQLLARWAVGYRRFKFECVSLLAALGLSSIDWAALPSLKPGLSPEEQLRDLFDSLPSQTSRDDVASLFVRHILMSMATSGDCCAILLGNSTTSLAAMTLAETAKGRGLSVPWLINDGIHPVMDCQEDRDSGETATPTIPVLFPLRELYRKELVLYGKLVGLEKDMGLSSDAGPAGPIVSHNDHSIDDVITRYFHEAELSYPSVVSNVVRTTARLQRSEPSQRCGICGLAVGARGNATWIGEKGDGGAAVDSPVEPIHGSINVCYGCDRSLRG